MRVRVSRAKSKCSSSTTTQSVCASASVCRSLVATAVRVRGRPANASSAPMTAGASKFHGAASGAVMRTEPFTTKKTSGEGSPTAKSR